VFERQDWELFRTVDGLSHKAGVPRQRLAALVAKELVDNALDESGACKISTIPNGFLVTNKGPGIDPTQVADLFSIKRPLRSTKLLRLPSRGALGNGLRVVAGAVLATGGSLKVYTRGQVMNLIPRPDGTTTVESIQIFPLSGTGVYVELGQDAGSINPKWAQRAILLAKGPAL
jgi:hypothetical protein